MKVALRAVVAALLIGFATSPVVEASPMSPLPRFKLVDLRMVINPSNLIPSRMSGDWVVAHGSRVNKAGKPIDAEHGIFRMRIRGKKARWESLPSTFNDRPVFVTGISAKGEVVGFDEHQSIIWSGGSITALPFDRFAVGINPSISPDGRFVTGGNYRLHPEQPTIIESYRVDRQTGERLSLDGMIAMAVNDKGDTAGYLAYREGNLWPEDVMIRRADGSYFRAPYGRALAINGQGVSAGYSQDKFASSQRPFVLKGNELLAIGREPLPNQSIGRAYGINEAGEVVGELADKAFLYSPQYGLLDLERVTQGLGDEWRLYAALGINDRGHILVVGGYRSDKGAYRTQLALLQVKGKKRRR